MGLRLSFQMPSIRLRQLVMPAFTIAYLGYFGFHAFHGSYGISARERFETEAAGLEAELARLEAEHADLDRHAKLLRPSNLDPDMIDERARHALNMIGPNEVLIVSPRGGPARD